MPPTNPAERPELVIHYRRPPPALEPRSAAPPGSWGLMRLHLGATGRANMPPAANPRNQGRSIPDANHLSGSTRVTLPDGRNDARIGCWFNAEPAALPSGLLDRASTARIPLNGGSNERDYWAGTDAGRDYRASGVPTAFRNLSEWCGDR